MPGYADVSDASRANASTSREVDARQTRHQAGLAGGLVAHQNKFGQLNIVLNSQGVKITQSVVQVLEFLCNAAEGPVHERDGLALTGRLLNHGRLLNPCHPCVVNLKDERGFLESPF